MKKSAPSAHYKDSNGLTISSREIGLFLTGLVVIFIVAHVSPGDGFRSEELAFSDPHDSGLGIVPASCPSSPHYFGECSYSQSAYYAQNTYYVQSAYYTQSSYYSPATCSVWFNQNPIAYGGGTTLNWTSSQAHSWVYIWNVGYVGASGSTAVAPLATTNYACQASGLGGTGSVSDAWLTVNPPVNCTAPWGSTVTHGASVTAYQAATVPYGQSCVSQSRTCTNGTLSGTYQYQSCAVGPACSLSVNPASVVQGQSSSLSWTSQNATSCTGGNFSTGGATAGAVSVAPSLTTAYTASCTGPGGTAQCSGTTLTVSCAPQTTYSCSGSSIVQTSISSACAVSVVNPYATCVAPRFCVNGASSCVIPDVTGSISASQSIVLPGARVTISWSTTDAVSCAVSGNGNTWSGTSGSQSSNPIVTSNTTYTLSCDNADDDSIEDDFITSVSIQLLPEWQEL